MEDTSQLIQMRVRKRTLDNIHELSSLTGVANRTQLVSASVDIAKEVLKSIKQEGAKVYIEHPDGRKEVLKLVGI